MVFELPNIFVLTWKKSAGVRAKCSSARWALPRDERLWGTLRSMSTLGVSVKWRKRVVLCSFFVHEPDGQNFEHIWLLKALRLRGASEFTTKRNKSKCDTRSFCCLFYERRSGIALAAEKNLKTYTTVYYRCSICVFIYMNAISDTFSFTFKGTVLDLFRFKWK
jgi:hypothetical protein